VNSASSTFVDSSLTPPTLGPYNENNNFYQHENAASREERTIEELLAWLNYPGMDQRREEVDRAHKNTFQWIFGFDGDRTNAQKTTGIWQWLASDQTQPETTIFVPLLRAAVEKAHKDISQWMFNGRQADAEDITGSRRPSTSDSTQPKNTSFVNWLREETGLLWIWGKPGAGKSTLMKYLMDDPRLEEHAKFWAGSQELSITSFFFWKLGSRIQRSLCGLYRALLWQILNDDRTLARKAFPGWQISFNTTEPGPEALRAAIDRLTQACVMQKKYLILIDGLDEYEDEGRDHLISQEILARDISHMVKGGFVKVIVASRPDRAFDGHFSHGRNFAIHDLTARDIERFARDRLVNDRTIRPSSETMTEQESEQLRRFIEDIVGKSQGVLWTRIVVDLMCVRMRNYYKVEQLQEILTELPPDLEDLFHQIMDRILKLKVPEKIESLRYLALTSHWFAAFASFEHSSSHWLPLSILGVGCELRSHKVTEPWLEENTQRLAQTGRNEPRIEGRVKSRCFGLLETSSIKVLSVDSVQYWNVVRPLHRTLVEYLSSHATMKNGRNLTLADDESFDANTAILVGLVVMKVFPLITPRTLDIPSIFQCVSVFNSLAEESTGIAQIATMSAFDRIMKEGFTALMRRYCHLIHDHRATCISASSGFDDLPDQNRRYLLAFENLAKGFALNPEHPLTRNIHFLDVEGFLDLLAITISIGSNALLKHRMNEATSGSRARVSIVYATHLLRDALNKAHFQPHMFPEIDSTAAEPNVEALRLLLQLGGRVDIPFDGISAWETFLDDILSSAMGNEHVGRANRDVILDLEALHCLVSHGAAVDSHRTWAACGDWQEAPEQQMSRFPGKLKVIEIRRYNFLQVVRQIANNLYRESELRPGTFVTEIAELEKLRHSLEKQKASSAPVRECSWSDLHRAVMSSVQRWQMAKVADALVTAIRTGRSIAEYQQIPVDASPHSDDGIVAKWMPCRETRAIPSRTVPQHETKSSADQITLPGDGQPADFDVVGWLVVEQEVL
jgi:hypothetical protein